MKEICRKAVSALMTGTMLAAMAARFPEQSASAANTY
jgi:hypothetical protein